MLTESSGSKRIRCKYCGHYTAVGIPHEPGDCGVIQDEKCDKPHTHYSCSACISDWVVE